MYVGGNYRILCALYVCGNSACHSVIGRLKLIPIPLMDRFLSGARNNVDYVSMNRIESE